MLPSIASLDVGLRTVKSTITYLFNNSEMKREKSEYILEPLQCIYNLALYSYYPVGTKISIHDNILILQKPSYSQGLVRWAYSDSKEDIYHLYYACKRFHLFYGFLHEYKIEDESLYDVIIKLAIKGLQKMIDTYNDIDKTSLLHTLRLYQNILSSPDAFNDDVIGGDSTTNIVSNIELIFSEITKIYSDEYLKLLCNLLRILEKVKGKTDSNMETIINIISGYQQIFKHKNDEIKLWISNNIIF